MKMIVPSESEWHGQLQKELRMGSAIMSLDQICRGCLLEEDECECGHTEWDLENIPCPKCDKGYDITDMPEGLVTMYGSESKENILKLTCGSCGHGFHVQEHVKRFYTYVS